MSKITVLPDLPFFRGNAREGEKDFTDGGINVRTFFRTLDNYFAQQKITDDAAKVRVVFAQVDKTRGNAIHLVTCYAGRDITYEALQRQFLQCYPNFNKTEVTHASKEVLKNKLLEKYVYKQDLKNTHTS